MLCVSRHPLLSKRVTQKHSKEALQQKKLIYKLPSLKARAVVTYLRHLDLKAIACPPIPSPPFTDPNMLTGDLRVNCYLHGLLSIDTNPLFQVKEVTQDWAKSLYLHNRHTSPQSAGELQQHPTFSQGSSQSPPTESIFVW